MGKSGRKVEFSLQRDIELREAYHRAYAVAHIPFTTEEIYNITVNTPCTRFWISAESAYKLISCIRNGRAVKLKECHKERIDEIMKRCKGDYSLLNVESVVYSPAPKFYIKPTSAQVILSRLRCKR